MKNKFWAFPFQRLLLLTVACSLMLSCNTTRLIKPLKQGDHQISVDAGGPVIGTPLPLSSISYAYGLKENLSVFGGLQLTDLAFNTIQMDLGANYGWKEPNGFVPGLSFNGVLNPIYELRTSSFRLFPETAINAYWSISEKHFPYVGFTYWYDLAYASTELGKGNFLHPTTMIGYRFEAKKWTIGLEAKWLNFDKALAIPQIQHSAIAGRGAVGFYLKVAYTLNK